MMVSNWINLWRGLLAMPIGVLVLMVFAFVAVAVVAHRISAGIRGPLALAGVFSVSFLLASITIETGGEPMAIGLFLAVLVGVGRSSYERLLQPRT